MAIVGFILLIGACVGHVAIMAYSLNWWYGNPLPHRLLSVIRLIHGAVVAAMPIGLVFAYGWDATRAVSFATPLSARDLVSGYVVVCWLVAFGLVPMITVGRLRYRPAALAHNHTETIDVAARLGYKPIGRGKYRHLGRLPGNEIFQVDFAEKTIHLPNLPPGWDGLSILHLTDLHLCGTPDREFYREVMDRCREWDPDLLALTGDVVDSAKHHRWVLPLLGRLRWRIGALAIIGNHDMWWEPHLVRRRLRRLGIQTVSNSWKQIDVRGEPMVVVGTEWPWTRPAPDLNGLPEGVFRLCLSHTPDNMPWARRNRMNLVLAGHNHGGQIRFPVIGSVLVPSRFSRRYDCGIFEERGTVLHVCRGVAGQHPLRYGCRPEVAKIVLRRA
jgi:predicted MPP superfamily phosphohydrolase